MKFCVDCYYYRESAKGLKEHKYATCERTKKYDMVSGVPIYQFCSIERESLRPEACGEEAKHYAEPEPQEFFPVHEPQEPVTNWEHGEYHGE